MMRLNVRAVFLAGLLATQVVLAQEPVNPGFVQAPATSFISDDDGGVVQIVPVALTAFGPAKANTVPAMKSIRPVSVFLGRSWAEASVRKREARLSDLTGDAELAPLHAQNINILPASASVEDATELDGPVNDLTIQKKLVAMLDSKTLPTPDASTVFVVFLAPGARLTVGNHTAGMHFAAYHNLVHVEAGELRYVVVPFTENMGNQAKAASLGLVNAAFNPASY